MLLHGLKLQFLTFRALWMITAPLLQFFVFFSFAQKKRKAGNELLPFFLPVPFHIPISTTMLL